MAIGCRMEEIIASKTPPKWRVPQLRIECNLNGHVGRNLTAVMRICDRWMLEGSTDRSKSIVSTSVPHFRQIVRMAVKDRSVTSRTVARHIHSVTHHSVSARTIRRRLQ
ncbi:transposable element Tcb1 transposase [Trichonephila clavipes]|nr:transposable element Tcb1 transposase [Trichonephila clavipes]